MEEEEAEEAPVDAHIAAYLGRSASTRQAVPSPDRSRLRSGATSSTSSTSRRRKWRERRQRRQQAEDADASWPPYSRSRTASNDGVAPPADHSLTPSSSSSSMASTLGWFDKLAWGWDYAFSSFERREPTAVPLALFGTYVWLGFRGRADVSPMARSLPPSLPPCAPCHLSVNSPSPPPTR